MKNSTVSRLFSHVAKIISVYTGRPTSFIVALAIILVWSISGPIFNWSDTWQLVINTGTTIITFLMVFLIQNTQNREGEALQLKLDELIRTNKLARNRLINMEDMSEEELDKIKEGFMTIYKKTKIRKQTSTASKRPGSVWKKK